MQQNVGNAKRMHMYADALNVCAGPYGAVALSSTVPPPGEREIISTKITGSDPTSLYLITMYRSRQQFIHCTGQDILPLLTGFQYQDPESRDPVRIFQSRNAGIGSVKFYD